MSTGPAASDGSALVRWRYADMHCVVSVSEQSSRPTCMWCHPGLEAWVPRGLLAYVEHMLHVLVESSGMADTCTAVCSYSSTVLETID